MGTSNETGETCPCGKGDFMIDDQQKTEKVLWQDYHFLTHEMVKCLNHDDFSLFEELLSQRQKLQLMIDACRKHAGGKDTGFASAEERGGLLVRVQIMDEELHRVFRLYYNARKNRSDAAMAYEGLDNPLVGMRMDKQR